MTNALLETIYNQLKNASTGITGHVYYINLPDLDILSTDNAIVYSLSLEDSTDTFDAKEISTTQVLEIRHIAKKGSKPLNAFPDTSIYKVKAAAYGLKAVSSRIGNVSLNSNFIEYDDELETYVMNFSFDLTINE